jgi:hypothetical protein
MSVDGLFLPTFSLFGPGTRPSTFAPAFFFTLPRFAAFKGDRSTQLISPLSSPLKYFSEDAEK